MNAIAGCLHSFSIQEKNPYNPLMRRFMAVCECGEWFGPWQRDMDSAIEDGYAHQEAESA